MVIIMINPKIITAWWCVLTILKNDGVRQWEGWHPIYEMENKRCLKPPTSIPELCPKGRALLKARRECLAACALLTLAQFLLSRRNSLRWCLPRLTHTRVLLTWGPNLLLKMNKGVLDVAHLRCQPSLGCFTYKYLPSFMVRLFWGHYYFNTEKIRTGYPLES